MIARLYECHPPIKFAEWLNSKKLTEYFVKGQGVFI